MLNKTIHPIMSAGLVCMVVGLLLLNLPQRPPAVHFAIGFFLGISTVFMIGGLMKTCKKRVA